MNSKEILEMNQRAKPDDEGALRNESRVRNFATICVVIFSLLLLCYILFKGTPAMIYMFCTIIFVRSASEALYRYWLTQRKSRLIQGVVSVCFCVGCLVRFVIATW